MRTVIFYYTGTGNSLWSARLLAAKLDDAVVRPLKGADVLAAGDAGAVGFVFPVHMWGVPGPVKEFAERLALRPDTYLFALAVNAGQVARTLVQLGEILARRGLTLAAGYDIVLPSNYIPWGGPGPQEKRQARIDAARAKIAAAAQVIAAGDAGAVERGPWWQRLAFTALYRLTYNQVPRMDKDFWCDERCDSCGTCARVCPAANIDMKKGRPEWRHRCEQCLACIQWCPREAIQFGKRTPAYERYHHPEITLDDMLP